MVRASADACDLYQIITAIFQESETLEEIEAKVSLVTECNGKCRTARHEFTIRLDDPDKALWPVMSLVIDIKAGSVKNTHPNARR